MIVMSGGRRCGKSLAQAKATAEALRAGREVWHASAEHGVEKVVGVPGFNDGRQLPPAAWAPDAGDKAAPSVQNHTGGATADGEHNAS